MGDSFPCNKCGLCCMNVNLSTEYQFLDRGDGTCIYFNTTTKLCNCYDNRPDICNISIQYQKKYKNIYTWNEFIALNLEGCNLLRHIMDSKLLIDKK